MGRLIGIDLGTTNSCAAVLDGQEIKVIPSDTGARTTPSIVAFRPDGSILVGDAAKRQALVNPTSTIHSVKRLIGRSYDSPEVAELRKMLSYTVVPSPSGDAWVHAGMLDFSPPEVSAHVLRYLKEQAERFLQDEVDQAIVTVPAYFNDAQRQATKDAGVIAGLEVRAILNEPTAAAVAYGIHKTKKESVIAVFDLGGDTFDVSILRVEDGVFEVLATAGDTLLGGNDFDRAVSEVLISEFEQQTGFSLIGDPAVAQRLQIAVETARHELSAATTTEINLPFIAACPEGPLHLVRTLERSWLESLTRPLIERVHMPCQLALGDAGLKPEQIDHLILVGGMTRMPAIQREATAIFRRPPTPGVNPDEIVAVGAATHSGIMSGAIKKVILVDVTPHTLGIRVLGDKVSPIIKRNSTVPLRQTKIFSTTEDDQSLVVIEVLAGESAHASGNRALAKFVLGDLPKRPAGAVQVQVSFMLDADGILHVEAVEATTGKATSKKVIASSGLSRDEVQRLAAQHKR